MLEILLLALAWTSDPSVLRLERPAPPQPMPMWARPAVYVVEANSSCAMSTVNNSTSIKKCLDRWEAASRGSLGLSRSDKETFQSHLRENFSEHALAAAEPLLGSVNANRLRKEYEWSVIANERGGITLEATPRDDVEQLFYRSLRVTLDAHHHTPTALAIVGRNQTQTVWQVEHDKHSDRIELVRFEDDVPPAPKPLVKVTHARPD